MKIGYFVTKFPYSQQHKDYAYGGSSLAAYYLSAEMAKRGHEVNVFTTSINSEDSIEKNENVTIFRYGTNFRIHTSNISFGMFKKPMDHNVDIIHTHFDIPPGPLACLRYAKKKKNPFIVTYHGDWVEENGGFFRRIGVAFHNKYLVDKILSYADVIISPSECYIAQSRFLFKYRDKLVVIPNGICLRDFDIPYSKEECRRMLGLPFDKDILLFLGYLSPYKGPDILLRSMPMILENVPDLKLIFVGDGMMRRELEMLSKKLDIEEHVKFMGFEGDLFKKALYYKSSDVFVLPSFSEIFGIVNLEAMACGIPIVASNIGGIPDVVKNGENGLLVPPRDSEALAKAIIYLLENRDIREHMGSDGREKVENYSWEKIAMNTEKVYERLLK